MSLADYFSLVRIPLAAAFLFVAGNGYVALAVLAAAGVSDVLDGWIARHQRDRSDVDQHRGDWLDPFCDKVFVIAVLAGVYAAHRPPIYLLLLVATRELLQGVALVVYKLHPRLRTMHYQYRAHPLGKATTVTQFATATALLFEHPLATPLAILAASLGVATVGIYLNRARLLARAMPPTATAS